MREAWLRGWRLYLVLGLFVLGLWRFLATVDPQGRPGGGVTLDGFYYYVYLHSLLKSGDLDLSDDYDFQGYDVRYPETKVGRPGNPFAVGPALLWAPFLLLASAVIRLRALLGETGLSVNVMSDAHQNLTLLGTYLYGCAAVFFAARILCLLHGPKERTLALCGALGAGLGGPLVYYMIACPSYSHAQSAFVFSVLVWYWLAHRERMDLRRWAVLGALAGLATLVHPGNVVLLLLLAPTAVIDQARALRPVDNGPPALAAASRALAGPLVAGACAVVVFSPQMLAWKAIYGRYLLAPQGPGFLRLSEPMWHATLFSPRNGLIPNSPLLGLALLGLLLMLRRRPAVAGSALLALAALALLNGAVYDWWGWGFGARRYTVAYPLFVIGLGHLLAVGRDLLLRRREQVARALMPLLVVLLVLFNLQLFREFRKGTLDGADLVPSRETYRSMFGGLMRDIFETVGNPLSFPASLVFALRHGVELQRYDKVSGFHFLDDNHQGANPHTPISRDHLDFTREWPERFLLAGWGKVQAVDKMQCRPAREPRAGLLLPLNVSEGIHGLLRVRPAMPGTRLRVLFNRTEVLKKKLEAGWQDLHFDVARRLIRREMNEVELEHLCPTDPVRRCPRTIGSTGVQAPVDLAAVGAGLDQGDFADIWVDGHRRCTDRRGLNLTTVYPRSGRVRDVVGFDVHLNLHASVALKKFVEHLPRGTLVLVASRDDASRRFDDSARQALRLIGARTDLSGKFRQAYAAIGVRGARPGTALESLAAERRAHACAGRVPPPWRVYAYYRILKLELALK